MLALISTEFDLSIRCMPWSTERNITAMFWTEQESSASK